MQKNGTCEAMKIRKSQQSRAVGGSQPVSPRFQNPISLLSQKFIQVYSDPNDQVVERRRDL